MYIFTFSGHMSGHVPTIISARNEVSLVNAINKITLHVCT